MRILMLVLLFLFSSIFLYGQDNNKKITKDDAINIALKKVIKKDTTVNYYISNSLNESTNLYLLSDTITLKVSPSWIIFIDDKPFESWEHPCRYIVINANDSKYEIINHTSSPDMSQFDPVHEIKYKRKMSDTKKEKTVLSKNIWDTNNDWAVIINGGMSKYWNWERYWNHISALYTSLINDYNFKEDHIIVLNSDGTSTAADRHLSDDTYDSSPQDLDNDGDDDIDYSATRANI
jgi:hypothetical protein